MNEVTHPCENCGGPIPPTITSNVARRKYCSDKCRYRGWKNHKEAELKELVHQLAGRGIRL